MPTQETTVNGNYHAFCDVRASILGQVWTGIKDINYKHSLKGTKVRGSQAQPLGRTKGEYDSEGDMTIYAKHWEELKTLLTSEGLGFLEQEFTITVTYAETNGAALQTDELIGVRIEEVDKQNSQGTDPLEVKLTLNIMAIKENGKKPFASMIG